MKSIKRSTSLLLAAAMALSMITVGCAAEDAVRFEDVPANAVYARAVAWCAENGLMNGVDDTHFDPDGSMTRAMLATVLYRQAGEPAVAGGPGFTDTQPGLWYSNAVAWAAEKGLLQGYGDGVFGVGDPVSREMLNVVMARQKGEDPAWTGAEELAADARRSEAAAALYETFADANVPASGVSLTEDGFTLVRGGSFQMGSPTGEPERSSDETQHSVTVNSFYMSKTEVSQKDYRAVMGTDPSETKGDELPVTNITWYDAIQYCNRLSEAAGLTPCYAVSGTTVTWDRAADGYRLPTEAEWEYAARADTATPFNFGDYVHNSDANCYNAYGYNNDASGNWVNGPDSYLRRPVAVDQYAANAYGLYNMHGNAAEWVWDWYGEYGPGTGADPTGPEGGNAKVVRGGGWNDQPRHIRSAYRGAQSADTTLCSIGMRPVRNAENGSGQVRSVYTAKAGQKTGKTLIVYFSQTGNTEGLANLIHEMSGADIFRLERATPYSSSSNGPALYGEALDELRAEAVPGLKEYPDTSRYDTILLGYCNWWSSIPAPVRSFLLHDDLSGKTIVPFCSMGGGRFGQTISAIAKLAPNSVIKEGLEVTYSSYDKSEIGAWLESSLSAGAAPTPAPAPGSKTRILVAYFSATNNTGGIARHIKAALGNEADLYEIVPETPYTSADLNYNTDCRANREQNDPAARPAISGSVEDMDQYDVVFLGYPIWWGQAPKLLYTFVESYDLTGKTIVPFCTSGSSGVGSSAENLAAATSGATWLSGSRFSGGDSRSAVENWVNGLDLPGPGA